MQLGYEHATESLSLGDKRPTTGSKTEPQDTRQKCPGGSGLSGKSTKFRSHHPSSPVSLVRSRFKRAVAFPSVSSLLHLSLTREHVFVLAEEDVVEVRPSRPLACKRKRAPSSVSKRLAVRDLPITTSLNQPIRSWNSRLVDRMRHAWQSIIMHSVKYQISHTRGLQNQKINKETCLHLLVVDVQLD